MFGSYPQVSVKDLKGSYDYVIVGKYEFNLKCRWLHPYTL